MSNNINELMRRLETLEQELDPNDANTNAKKKGKKLDKFTKSKNNASKELREIRKLISERDQLLEKGNNGETVKLSSEIRKKIRIARDEAQTMGKIYREKQRKLSKKKDADRELLAKYEKVVELTHSHIEECESLEKKRFTERNQSNKNDLMNGAATKKSLYIDPNETELEDIDSVEVTQALQAFEEKNAQIDDVVDDIQEDVYVLKGLAKDMNEEVDRQNIMLDEVNNKVQKNLDHTKKINKKMKGILKKVRGGDRFIVDLILIIVVLAIVGAVVNQVVKVAK